MSTDNEGNKDTGSSRTREAAETTMVVAGAVIAVVGAVAAVAVMVALVAIVVVAALRFAGVCW